MNHSNSFKNLPDLSERNFTGYGEDGINQNFSWPEGQFIAVQFVINYEEGGENCVLNGDSHSESFLSEIIGAPPFYGVRHMNMESIYEYGSRAGFWRLHRIFNEAQIAPTVYAVASAIEKNQAAIEAMLKSGWEVASHGYKWIDYQFVSETVERDHIQKAIEIHRRLTGDAPKGWYTGRTSPNSRRLVLEALPGLRYDSDSYADDLPYFERYLDRVHLVIPYTLDTNDMRFASPQGFNCGDQFFTYLKDAFDVLYREGREGAPKMLNVGLHCRLVGRPARAAALVRFIEYAKSHDKVWFPRRIEIAEHFWNHLEQCE